MNSEGYANASSRSFSATEHQVKAMLHKNKLQIKSRQSSTVCSANHDKMATIASQMPTLKSHAQSLRQLPSASQSSLLQSAQNT